MNKSGDSQVVKSRNIYQFNITLHHITPITWRRIQVPGHYNFRDLHYAIQDAMGWKDCHLHQFEMINPKTGHEDMITPPDPDYDFPFVLEEKAKIAEYFLSPKDKAIYEYDPCGESWTLDIVLEQILPAVTYPQCLAGEGACPKKDDDQLCSSSTDQFDPKSVIFQRRECQDDARLKIMSKATEAYPPTDCGGADRGNTFNPKSISLSKDVNSNTVSKATEVRLIKRACPPTDCGGVDRGNNFNPKLIRLSNDVDSSTVNKATEKPVVKCCNVYQFKIILQRFKPPIWRRVQVPGEYSFKDLHYVIQKAMGWKNRHLHRFTMKNPKTGEEDLIQVPDSAYRDICVIKNERETKIAEHFLAPKDKAIYEYDLGFSWTHDIVLEKILPAVASITYPQCLAGRRKTPKEDPTESEQEDEELFYNPDEDKFDPKSVKFS